MALFAGLFVAICLIVLIDILKTPIKSKSDIEAAADLPVIGTIPNRDRGERLLANIRFICDEPPSTIAVVPVGLTGSTLTCAELTSALEHSKVSVSRVQGNAHAEGFNHVSLPGIVTIIECAPLSEGVGAVYIAKEADITILCATEWRDSRKALAAIVEEFRFAKIKLGGVVFLTSRYHYQIEHPQAKLVRVVSGKVFDVAVDLRKGSPTYGKWEGVVLSAENKRQFFIPRGFTHGFLVLSDTAEFCYKCDDVYHPNDEGDLMWNDPAIGIEWPALEGDAEFNPNKVILSEKDKLHPSIPEI